VLFPVRPQIFHRIQFRSVAGKKLQPETSFLLPHKIPYRTTAVAGQAIPDDQQLTGKVPLQMLQELDDLRAADSSRE